MILNYYSNSSGKKTKRRQSQKLGSKSLLTNNLVSAGQVKIGKLDDSSESCCTSDSESLSENDDREMGSERTEGTKDISRVDTARDGSIQGTANEEDEDSGEDFDLQIQKILEREEKEKREEQLRLAREYSQNSAGKPSSNQLEKSKSRTNVSAFLNSSS